MRFVVGTAVDANIVVLWVIEGSSVGIATGLSIGRSGVRISAGTREFYLL
jgi:hypothetical protein